MTRGSNIYFEFSICQKYNPRSPLLWFCSPLYVCQPARQYPNVFSEESIFGRYSSCLTNDIDIFFYKFKLHSCIWLYLQLFPRFPYLLPCLSISIFSAVVLVSCIWLPVCDTCSHIVWIISHFISYFHIHAFSLISEEDCVPLGVTELGESCISAPNFLKGLLSAIS